MEETKKEEVKIQEEKPVEELKNPVTEALSRYVKPHGKVARDVTESDIEKLKADSQVMFTLCFVEGGKYYYGTFAIAHNQIEDKDPLRFFVTNDFHIIVNPVITNHTKATIKSEETCTSFPDNPPILVDRYNKVTVSYHLFDGEKLVGPFEDNLSGKISKIFQHEINYLDAQYIYKIQ